MTSETIGRGEAEDVFIVSCPRGPWGQEIPCLSAYRKIKSCPCLLNDDVCITLAVVLFEVSPLQVSDIALAEPAETGEQKGISGLFVARRRLYQPFQFLDSQKTSLAGFAPWLVVRIDFSHRVGGDKTFADGKVHYGTKDIQVIPGRAFADYSTGFVNALCIWFLPQISDELYTVIFVNVRYAKIGIESRHSIAEMPDLINCLRRTFALPFIFILVYQIVKRYVLRNGLNPCLTVIELDNTPGFDGCSSF